MSHSKAKQLIQFVQFSGQTSKFVFGTLLLSLISDDISNEVHKQSSMLVRFIPYVSLSMMMLIVWCAVYYFLTDPHGNPQVKGCVDFQVIGRLDPQDVTGRLDTQVTRRPDLPLIDPEVRDMFHCYMNENERDEFPDIPHHVASEILSPEAISRSSRAQQRSDFVSITIQSERPVPTVEATLRSTVTLPLGSKVLYRTFEIGFHTHRSEWDNLLMEMTEAMRQARTIDEDCTLQFGSFAVLKYTEAGPKWWRLQKHWTPIISNIHRSSCNLVELVLTGCHTKWIIRGFNLQQATVKASTVDDIEMLNISHHKKVESGEDLLFCDEPHLVSISAPLFRQGVYICASNFVEVEEGVTFNLQTEPKSVKRAYWISVLESLMPSPWTIFMIASFSVLGGLSYGTHGKQDSLFRASASSYLYNFLGVHDKEGNSILSHILSELYKCCLVYISVIFIPFFLVMLRQLGNVHISPLGNATHGLEVKQTSEECDVTNNSPTTPPSADGNSFQGNTTSHCGSAIATPIADVLLDDTTSSPTAAIPVEVNFIQSSVAYEHFVHSREEETYKSSPVFGVALTPASTYSKRIVSLRTAPTAMVHHESFEKGDTLKEHSQSSGDNNLRNPPSMIPAEDSSNTLNPRVGNEIRTQLPQTLSDMGKLKRKSDISKDLESSRDNKSQGAKKTFYWKNVESITDNKLQGAKKTCSGIEREATSNNDQGSKALICSGIYLGPEETSTNDQQLEKTSQTLLVKEDEWNTFEQYLRDHGLELYQCNGANVLDFLRYLEQFGQSKIHVHSCCFYGSPNHPNNPCQCPLQQDWRHLDMLVNLFRDEFEKRRRNHKSNPFGGRLVRLYLREMRESQEKACGIAHQRKKRKHTSRTLKESIGSKSTGDHQDQEKLQPVTLDLFVGMSQVPHAQIEAEEPTPNGVVSGFGEYERKKQKMLGDQATALPLVVKSQSRVAALQAGESFETRGGMGHCNPNPTNPEEISISGGSLTSRGVDDRG